MLHILRFVSKFELNIELSPEEFNQSEDVIKEKILNYANEMTY